MLRLAQKITLDVYQPQDQFAEEGLIDVNLLFDDRVSQDVFWSRLGPPLHVRDKIRESQRFDGQSIELFIVRPAFERPGQFIEETIAQVTTPQSSDRETEKNGHARPATTTGHARYTLL